MRETPTERNHESWWSLVLIFLVLLGSRTGLAQEVFVNGGFMDDTDTGEKSYAWSLEYFEGLGEHLGFSFSWINEGHVKNHHRDGCSPQIWLRKTVKNRRLSLKAGIGPYQYFDTTHKSADDGYEDLTGWGIAYSVGACWYSDSPWVVQFMANYIDTFHSLDSASAVLGVGYQLDRPEQPGPRRQAPTQTEYTTDQEITVFLGKTVVNSFGSEESTAQSVEYRRGLSRHIEGTIAWINEGDAELIRRNGMAAQLWLTRAFFGSHLILGVGGGVYYLIDRHRDPVPNEARGDALTGLVTTTGSYRWGEHWLTRLSWNRVVTDYDRDADVFLLGLGYRL